MQELYALGSTWSQIGRPDHLGDMVQFDTSSGAQDEPAGDTLPDTVAVRHDALLTITPRGRELLALLREEDDG